MRLHGLSRIQALFAIVLIVNLIYAASLDAQPVVTNAPPAISAAPPPGDVPSINVYTDPEDPGRLRVVDTGGRKKPPPPASHEKLDLPESYAQPIFNDGGPSPYDLQQALVVPNCYFIAVLQAIAQSDPGLLENTVSKGDEPWSYFFKSQFLPCKVITVDSNLRLLVDGTRSALQANTVITTGLVYWPVLIAAALRSEGIDCDGTSGARPGGDSGLILKALYGPDNVGYVTRQGRLVTVQDLQRILCRPDAERLPTVLGTLRDRNDAMTTLRVTPEHAYAVMRIGNNAEGEVAVDIFNPIRCSVQTFTLGELASVMGSIMYVRAPMKALPPAIVEPSICELVEAIIKDLERMGGVPMERS